MARYDQLHLILINDACTVENRQSHLASTCLHWVSMVRAVSRRQLPALLWLAPAHMNKAARGAKEVGDDDKEDWHGIEHVDTGCECQ